MSETNNSENIPPPPTSQEFEVRTLESDVAQMGGKASQISTVPFRVPVIRDSVARSGGMSAASALPSKKYIVWIWSFVALILIGALFAGGYYVIPMINGNSQPESKSVSASSASSASSTSSSLPNTSLSVQASTTFLGYESFAKVSVDSRYNLTLGTTDGPNALAEMAWSAVGTSTDLVQNQFSEIILRDTEGKYWAWVNFIKAMGLSGGVSESVWRDLFEQNFNIFVDRDSSALWPAYVLKLKQSQSPLLLQAQIADLEKTTSWTNLFFADPGDPVGGFIDVKMLGNPARELQYTTPGARLIYGWSGENYLVIATSEEAYRNALSHL